jgi:OOP family OmpA-OmpF porin
MKKFFVATGLVALGTLTTAGAGELYVGADIGLSILKAGKDISVPGTFGASVGYTLNPNFAIEASARSLGTLALADSSIQVASLQASLLGIAPVTNEFSLFSRLGVGHNKIDLVYQAGFNYQPPVSVNKTQALFGLGAGYKLSKSVMLRAEYSDLGTITVSSDTAPVKITQFKMGVNYAF